MEDQQSDLCIDRVVPSEYAHSTIGKAIEENPSNRKPPANPFEAAAIRSKLWLPGRTLRVRFLDGHPLMQQRVIQYARRWCNYANINFDFGDHPEAEIRISFTHVGSWSAVGTDALVSEYFGPNDPTMNFGWLQPHTPDEEYQCVALHEFGHALGLIHEHQSPAGGMQWDEDAVYQRYAGPPNYWDRDTIRRNILNRYEVAQTQFTAFDPDSIMLYAYPSELTLNRRATKRNMDLSAQDIAFIAQLYPHHPDIPTP
jgi:hypothetical protein